MVSLETSSDFPIYVTDTVHFVGFSNFCPTFRNKIDELFSRVFNLTLILLDLILLVEV